MKLRKPAKKNARYYLKKAAVATVGTVTAASVLAGGLFSSPKEIVNGLPQTPPAIVEVYESDDIPDEDRTTPKRRRSLRERIKETLLAWPLWLRAVLLVPLWGVGTAGSLLMRTLLPAVIKWLLGALFPALLLLLGLKLLFPDIPWHKLLCRRNRIALAVLLVLLFITGPVLGHFWPDRTWLVLAVKTGLLALVFLIACAQILAVQGERKPVRK